MFFLLPVIAGVISSAAATAGEVALGIGAATAIKRNVPPCTLAKTSSDAVNVTEYRVDEICEKLIVQKNIR